jgi:hypothetical protein
MTFQTCSSSAAHTIVKREPSNYGCLVAVEFITIVWRLSPYRAEKLLVQLAFADWANLEGEFHPTYEEIAEKARVTKPGAIGIVQSMIEEGELELVKRGRGRGSRNCYRFAEKYRIAVRELSERWAEKRAKRVKAVDHSRVNQDDLLQREKVNEGDHLDRKRVNHDDHSRVNQDDLLQQEKVNEACEKGKRGMTHIRNNRHEPLHDPSVKRAHAPPFDDFGAGRSADLTPNFTPLEFALCAAVGWLPDSLTSTRYDELLPASSLLARHSDATPDRIGHAAAFYRSQGKFNFKVEWIANDWGLISAWIEAQSSPAPAPSNNSRTAQRQQASARAKEILFGGGNKR